MDIDNDYYLAKFESDLDYNNVIAKGPWVIFGNYLTVEPWSLEFSTMDSHPQSVVAWVRILGLFGAYTKGSYCRKLGALLGK